MTVLDAGTGAPRDAAALDWQAAYARLAAEAEALARGGAPPPEVVRRVLAERARQWAQPPAAPAAAREPLAVVGFALGDARYALAVQEAVEAAPLPDVTPLPRVPAPLRGVVYHRGRVVPVVDLRLLLGPAGAPGALAPLVVIAAAGEAVVGLLADALLGTVEVDAADLLPAPTTGAGGPTLVRGVTREQLIVLDLEAILSDPRVLINDMGRDTGSPAVRSRAPAVGEGGDRERAAPG